MKTIELIKVKLALECIGIEMGKPFNKLVRIGGSTCDDIERLCVIRDGEGQFHYFFGDYELGERFNTIFDDEMFLSDQIASQLVQTVELRRELWYCATPEYPPLVPYPLVVEVGDNDANFDNFVIIVDGEVVSNTYSVRRNATSAESATNVNEGHRKKGYGSQTVAAWSASQLAKGKLGINACKKGNVGSHKLIERVGSVFIGDVLSFQ